MPRAIHDQFSDLPISRERKRQLRHISVGFCAYGGCDKPLASASYCAAHAIQNRENKRAKFGSTKRYRAQSYCFKPTSNNCARLIPRNCQRDGHEWINVKLVASGGYEDTWKRCDHCGITSRITVHR